MRRSSTDRRRRQELHDLLAFDTPRAGDSDPNGFTSRGVLDPRPEHLRRLGDALDATGDYAVRLMEYRTKPPELHVSRKGAARLVEDIGAECDGDDVWWLLWSWGERMCRADDIPAALESIGRVLSVRDRP